MKIKHIIGSLMIVFLFLYGCEGMDDNYKQYVGEYNYSGKIDSLRVYPGYERVVLAWDNPKDQKSKSIRILYGPDSTEVLYPSMVDSVSIEGLDAGTGYEFIVYTMDSHNNLSVPTSITAFPISKNFVDNLTPPSLVVDVVNNEQVLSVIGTSNVLMTFSGLINITISNANGVVSSKNLNLKDKVITTDPNTGAKKINALNNLTIPVKDLGLSLIPPGEYTFNFTVSVWPLMGNQVSIDEVELDNQITTTVTPIIINITKMGGVVSDKFNTTGGEGIAKLTDGNYGSKYLTGNRETWVKFKTNAPSIVTRYKLVSGNDAPERDPLNWKLEGSNDDSNWTVLDTRSGIKFPLRKQLLTFEFNNNTSYQYYRMTIQNNGSNLFQLAEWELWGPRLN